MSTQPTILAVSVGGSCQPVVTAVNDFQPHHVVFIASGGTRGSKATVAGAGAPCKDRTTNKDKPSIVAQTGLNEFQFTILTIEDPDSLQDCYSEIRTALAEVMRKFPDCRYVADYTGGTKTMSVALALAALEADWKISLVKGARTDLVRVADGTEVASLVNIWEVRARQRMQEARRLFNDHHYAAAETLVRNILQTGPVSTELQTILREWIGLARGFDAWDRFDHARALQIMSPYQGRVVENFIFLKQILGEIRNATGYEAAFDLVRNAERRAHQGRYDDAVARLYRACEMFAQLRLKERQPSLNSSNLEIELLPEDLRPIYEQLRDPNNKRIKLGLRQDFKLLVALDDPVGRVYRSLEKPLLNGLNARNNSILAHGTTPLNFNGYREFAKIVGSLFDDACKRLDIAVKAPQFPKLDEPRPPKEQTS